MLDQSNGLEKNLLLILIALTFSGVQAVFAGEVGSEPKPTPHILFALYDREAPHAKELGECEKLTIQGYRDRGTRVTEISHADLKKWLEGEGKAVGKADQNSQFVAMAKSLGVHAVGGLSVLELTADMVEGSPLQPGSHFHSWGYALNACAHGSGMEFEGEKVRAIPLRLLEQGDPWSVPMTIEPTTCSPGSGSGPSDLNKGRPFLGVQLDGNEIRSVSPESPAAAAGLKAGDNFVAMNGSPIKDTSDLVAIMGSLKPGTEVEIEFRRGSESIKKKTALADRYEAVDVKGDQEGKPLPTLTATDIDGREVRLDSFRGKVVLLDFWATWCSPCREEMPLLQMLSEKFKDRDFVWIGVSVDEDKDAWESYVRNNRLGGIQLRSPEWANAMFVSGYPTVLLADRTGTFRCNVRGNAVAQSVLGLLGAKP